jgi:NADPH:quinone reductase-like Zn-dependent oxidoreductase
MPEDLLVRAPKTLTATEASTLSCAGLTVWFALVERPGVQAGDIMLIRSTVGVALLVLHIAKANGAEIMIGGYAFSRSRRRPSAIRHLTGTSHQAILFDAGKNCI